MLEKKFLLQVARSFRPDFVLVRQPPRDGSRDYRSTLLGLKFGGVPSINSLHAVYQFQVKRETQETFFISLTFNLLKPIFVFFLSNSGIRIN